MNGFSAADMSTAAANGFRDGLTAQPAAAQEAVAWRIDGPAVDGSTFTQFVTDSEFANLLRRAGIEITVSPLYAAPVAPVAAAPVVEASPAGIAELFLRMWEMDCKGLLPAEIQEHWDNLDLSCVPSEYGGDLQKIPCTPAAPGIDLSKLQTYRMASGPDDVRNLYRDPTGNWVRLSEVERLIDASPKAPPPSDGCTESNCKRCRTHPNHRAPWERQWEPTKAHWRARAIEANTPAAPVVTADERDLQEKCQRIQENRDFWHGVAEKLREELFEAQEELARRSTHGPRATTMDAARFEEWCPYNIDKHPSGHYVNEDTWHAWAGWKAAMQATSAEVGS